MREYEIYLMNREEANKVRAERTRVGIAGRKTERCYG
jgi:hypothetical protein